MSDTKINIDSGDFSAITKKGLHPIHTKKYIDRLLLQDTEAFSEETQRSDNYIKRKNMQEKKEQMSQDYSESSQEYSQEYSQDMTESY